MDLVRVADLWEENQEFLRQALGQSNSDRFGARWVLMPEIPLPKFNHISKVRIADSAVAELIAECRAFFRRHRLPNYSIMTTPATRPVDLPKRLFRLGFVGEAEPVMIWDGTAVFHPSGAIRVELATPADATLVYDVIRRVFFEGAGEETTELLRRNVSISYEVGARFYIAYYGAQPAGVGMLFARSEMGGIYNMGTLRLFRGLGVARAVLACCLREAQEMGCAHVGLTPTAMGRPVYERLGFREVCQQFYISDWTRAAR